MGSGAKLKRVVAIDDRCGFFQNGFTDSKDGKGAWFLANPFASNAVPIFERPPPVSARCVERCTYRAAGLMRRLVSAHLDYTSLVEDVAEDDGADLGR